MMIRGFRPGDTEALLATWNSALPADPIDLRTFRRKVLLDANFRPEGLLIAESDGGVAGLCLCLVRRVPIEGGDLEPDRGWITAFGVCPAARRQGIGAELLDRARRFFEREGRREVLIAPYTPNYFAPGVDVARYAEGVRFLAGCGFETVSNPLSMDANIVLLDTEPFLLREAGLAELGVCVRAMETDDIPGLFAFLRDHASPDWLRHARQVLTETRSGGGLGLFTIAKRGEEVVGYCQFEGEHFGPFGVREDLRGKGIGTVLLARCLRRMQQAGLHHAWVLWTSDETAERVYGRFGFRETRRFAVMRKRF